MAAARKGEALISTLDCPCHGLVGSDDLVCADGALHRCEVALRLAEPPEGNRRGPNGRYRSAPPSRGCLHARDLRAVLRWSQSMRPRDRIDEPPTEFANAVRWLASNTYGMDAFSHRGTAARHRRNRPWKLGA